MKDESRYRRVCCSSVMARGVDTGHDYALTLSIVFFLLFFFHELACPPVNRFRGLVRDHASYRIVSYRIVSYDGGARRRVKENYRSLLRLT